MKPDQARKLKDVIVALCEKHGVYFETSESCKPCLKNITITVNVKVDDSNGIREKAYP